MPVKSKRNDGKELELLTQKIQQQLAPNAKVTHNETIIGKSGAPNQIDVSVRGDVGQFPFLAVVECKDWSRPVDIDVVRAFKTKKLDVKAHHAIIVSRNGFTDGAKKLAEAEDITLYDFLDAENEDWKNIPLIPIVLIRIYLSGATLQALDIATGEQSGVLVSDRILDEKKGSIINLKSFMEARWDEVFKDIEPKSSDFFETKEGDFSFVDNNGLTRPAILRYSFSPTREYYTCKLPIKTGLGLIDSKTGRLFSPSYNSELFSFGGLMKKWQKIEDPENIPEHAMTFFMGMFFNKDLPNVLKEGEDWEVSIVKDGETHHVISRKLRQADD